MDNDYTVIEPLGGGTWRAVLKLGGITYKVTVAPLSRRAAELEARDWAQAYGVQYREYHHDSV